MTKPLYPHGIQSTVELSVASPPSDLLRKPLGISERGIPGNYGIALQDIGYVAKRDDEEPDLDYFAGRITFIANNLEGHAGVTPECTDTTKHNHAYCLQVCDLEDVRGAGDELPGITGKAVWQKPDGSHSLVTLESVTASGISKVVLPVDQDKSITAFVFPPRPVLFSRGRKVFKNRRQNFGNRYGLRENDGMPEELFSEWRQWRHRRYRPVTSLNGALQGFLVEKRFQYRDVNGIEVEVVPVQHKGGV